MSVPLIPLSVPKNQRARFRRHFQQATRKTGRLILFAGDQKVEHLNADFYGRGIAPEDANPEHLFKIASQAEIGVFATHLGLIDRYGQSYKNIPYLVKLNGRTNLFTDKEELDSRAWFPVETVIDFKNQSRLNIVGVGYTIYLGGRRESRMLKEAARVIYEAHQNGLLAVVWIYPRSSKIKNESDIHLTAGAAGVAAALGADFVKVHYPYDNKNALKTATDFQEVTAAAGKTGVICVGGSKQSALDLIKTVHLQINKGQSRGLALGRNLHQRPLEEAIRLSRALSAIIYKNKTEAEAIKLYKTPLPRRHPVAKFLNFFSF